MIKRIAVYCGARNGNKEQYKEEAYTLGKWLALHQIELVYGGGKYGLMGAVAKGALDNGGMVHGVITELLKKRGTAFEKIQDLIVVPDMDRRKEVMMELADGMVALPGGIGTLEEISQAASWITIGENAKPVVFYNQNGFYTDLQKLFAHMNQEGFLEAPYFNSLHFSESFEDMLDFMNKYQAPDHRTYQ